MTLMQLFRRLNLRRTKLCSSKTQATVAMDRRRERASIKQLKISMVTKSQREQVSER